jgi:hypothetical protein
MSWSLFSDVNTELLNNVKLKFGFSDSDVKLLEEEAKKSSDQVKAMIRGSALRTFPSRDAQKLTNTREVQQRLLERVSELATNYSDEPVGVVIRTTRFGNKGPALIHATNGVLVFVRIVYQSLHNVPNEGTVVTFKFDSDTSHGQLLAVSKVNSHGAKAMAFKKRRLRWHRRKQGFEPGAVIGRTLERIELDEEFSFTGKGSRKHKVSA